MSREVFKYHNGNEEVFADPLRCYRALFRVTGGEFATLLEDSANSENINLALSASEKLQEAVRDVFQLRGFDPKSGEGVTDEESERLLDRFLDWLDKKKLKSA